MRISLNLVAILLLICVEVFGNQVGPEVQIRQGALRGKYEKTRKGRTFRAFTGIPFAKPPVGDLRFKAPVPAESWKGTLDASKPHAVCPQSNPLTGNFSGFGIEDCLYLNVYSPQLSDLNHGLLPVMFYVHGGAFVLGSAGPDWYGADVFLDKDIVFVATNYRLGALGFLSTGDEVVPGNNGLKDQTLALKWVKNNIADFGGDPERITSVGHSAGAACSHYHVLSPVTRDLIIGAIAQSGNANAFWALAPDGEATKNAKRLAEFLDCPTTSNKAMIDCLKKIDANVIVKQEQKFLDWALDPMIPFKPVIEPNIEGAFLREHPVDIIKSGNAANIPFMTGITTEDGAIKSSAYYGNPNWIKDFDKEFNRVAPLTMQYDFQTNKNTLSKKLRNFYFDDKGIDDTTKDELTDMFTDVYFLMWAEEAVRLHSKYSVQPVYYYLFGYRGSESYSRIFGDPTHNYGVCHADELIYLYTLGQKFPDFDPTETDKKMTEVLTTLWVNFATNGNPTPQKDSVISTLWEPVKTDHLEYYFIKSADKMEMAKDMYSERAKFVKELGLYSKKTIVRNEL